MDVEIAALHAKETMVEIDCCDVPGGQQIIKSTWAFKRKRRPNGDIHKLKSPFVVLGDLQILAPTEQTYSPVVDWSTVRLLFVLATARKLHSTTIDLNARAHLSRTSTRILRTRHHETDSLTFIAELREAGFDLGIESDYAGYLGVEVAPQQDGSLMLTQTGLIQRILDDLHLTDATTTKPTPAHGILSYHSDAPPLNQSEFVYRSVLGKLMYLSTNTRPDIAFANHQCAPFSIDPKVPHSIALKRIGRYLLGTKDKGMLIKPSESLKLDCYADADFAGLFSSSDPDDPKSVKSRTGFVLTLAGIPLSWSSKLQTETALSTMESEYISLSQSKRVLLPLSIILDEVATGLHLKPDPHLAIHSTSHP